MYCPKDRWLDVLYLFCLQISSLFFVMIPLLLPSTAIASHSVPEPEGLFTCTNSFNLPAPFCVRGTISVFLLQTETLSLGQELAPQQIVKLVLHPLQPDSRACLSPATENQEQSLEQMEEEKQLEVEDILSSSFPPPPPGLHSLIIERMSIKHTLGDCVQTLTSYFILTTTIEGRYFY